MEKTRTRSGVLVVVMSTTTTMMMMMMMATMISPVASVAVPLEPSPIFGNNTMFRPVSGRFSVSLDAPADTRWSNVIAAANFTELKDFIDDVFARLNMTKLRPLAEKILGLAVPVLGKEWADEVRSIAKAANFPVADVLVLNLFYEISGGCTSIVANTVQGHVMHARNLDYSIQGLRPITAVVDFTKNGKVQYTCTTYLGYAGCLTGMRPTDPALLAGGSSNGWSVSVNERDTDGESILTKMIENLVSALFEGGKSIGMFLRETMQNTPRYVDALEVLKSTHLVRPVYLTVGGAEINEGAIITRDRLGLPTKARNGSAIPAAFSVQTLSNAKERGVVRSWLLQTNDDIWNSPSDTRRPKGESMMAYVCTKGPDKHKCDHDGVLNVLSTRPVLNGHTTYTTVSAAKLGMHWSMVRNVGD